MSWPHPQRMEISNLFLNFFLHWWLPLEDLTCRMLSRMVGQRRQRGSESQPGLEPQLSLVRRREELDLGTRQQTLSRHPRLVLTSDVLIKQDLKMWYSSQSAFAEWVLCCDWDCDLSHWTSLHSCATKHYKYKQFPRKCNCFFERLITKKWFAEKFNKF